MNKTLITMMAGLGLYASASAATADYRVVPLPAEINVTAGAKSFMLNKETQICCAEELASDARMLQQYLKDLTGFELNVRYGVSGIENAIYLSVASTDTLSDAYSLTVSPCCVDIKGVGPDGLFFGIQTLRKSIGVDPVDAKGVVELPCVEIKDTPRYSYRGMHLDVSRHFMSVADVKEYLDIMALHNINRFHWHLTDDQGWRIEIKSHPELTEKGSWRKETMVAKNWGEFDGTPYGGFYTQDEIRDIVKYAADRHITVIPEIDLPGHMQGALHCYPNLGCTGGPYEVWTQWGVSDDVLCPGNEEVFKFLEDVFTEIMQMFPSEYIHIGGDECPKVRWKDCPKCQQRIAEQGIVGDDEHSAEEYLQSYVIKRIEKYLNDNGRRIIGWDEILEGGVSSTATVMSWRGEEGGKYAAGIGNDVIMTPGGYCYFDHYQSEDTEHEPLAFGGYTPLEKIYGYDATPAELTPEQAKHILGLQANLWTEYIHDMRHAEYMVLPRQAALAESQWCDPSAKSYPDFLQRLQRLERFYDLYNYNYRKGFSK